MGGFIRKTIRKLTGTDEQIKSANRNAAAQIAATEAASAAAQRAAMDSARAMSIQQQQLSERARIEMAVRDIQQQPQEVAEISLAEEDGESLVSKRRRRQAQFGTGYTTGVSI